jgi:hypothetical protein
MIWNTACRIKFQVIIIHNNIKKYLYALRTNGQGKNNQQPCSLGFGEGGKAKQRIHVHFNSGFEVY